MAQITAVTFDLWQTLLLDNRDLGHARAQVRLEEAQSALERFGETYGLEEVRQAYLACYEHCQKIRGQNRDLTFREQVEVFIGNIQAGLLERLPEETVQEILRSYADSFFVHPPVRHEDALAVLSSVKGLGLKIGLISNTGMTPGVTFRRFLEQQGMLQFFDALTFSDEVQLAKPSREIFLITLQQLGSAPGESIHVGDHLENDMVGAKRLGMKTIWIEGFSERVDPADSASQPDARVSRLGEVAPAVKRLCNQRVSS